MSNCLLGLLCLAVMFLEGFLAGQAWRKLYDLDKKDAKP